MSYRFEAIARNTGTHHIITSASMGSPVALGIIIHFDLERDALAWLESKRSKLRGSNPQVRSQRAVR